MTSIANLTRREVTRVVGFMKICIVISLDHVDRKSIWLLYLEYIKLYIKTSIIHIATISWLIMAYHGLSWFIMIYVCIYNPNIGEI